MLNKLITSRTRLKLLIKFFISQANKGHLNGLASEMGESTNSIRKELNNLFEAGYLDKHKKNNKVVYNVNIKHPLYNTLREIVMKILVIFSESVVFNSKTSHNKYSKRFNIEDKSKVINNFIDRKQLEDAEILLQQMDENNLTTNEVSLKRYLLGRFYLGLLDTEEILSTSLLSFQSLVGRKIRSVNLKYSKY